jgi:Transposase IS200 like
VHLLISLRATHRLADVLRELKSVSSAWVHDEIGIHAFAWQEGYGAFTVSASQRKAVRRYIEQQAAHHRTRPFREEYLELLRRSGVEFDERLRLIRRPCRGWVPFSVGRRWFAPPANHPMIPLGSSLKAWANESSTG